MTLFVAGVHAVGKSFVLGPVCASLGIRHVTASQLIKEQRGLSNWTASRQVDDIDENQRVLVAAVQRLRQSGEKFVMDGHFVLRRSAGVHEKIGLETFSRLLVERVVLLESGSAVITDRLLRRGDNTWDAAEVEVFSQMESEHADYVCRELGVPLVRLASPSEQQVKEVIAGFFA